jgi:hypothetical protein
LQISNTKTNVAVRLHHNKLDTPKPSGCFPELWFRPSRQLVRHVDYRYPEGAAPTEQAQSVKLKRGKRYLIEARLGYADRTETVTRELTFHQVSRITVRL